MLLKDKKIGFALTGSFCTFEKTITQISRPSNFIPTIFYTSLVFLSKLK